MPQNTPRQDDQQPASMRKYCSPRAQTRPSIATEYQERFLPPHCHTAIVTGSTQRNPYHALKGPSNEENTLRSIRVTKKCVKQPPNAPLPSESPKHHRRYSSCTHNQTHFEAEQMASKVEDYTSVYKSDFQAWKVKKRLSYKLVDSMTVTQGLVITDRPSQGRFQNTPVQVAADSRAVPQVRKAPFESVTSYRSDYVTHPVQPRHRVKPEHPTKGLLAEPAVPLKPRVAWDQDICDEASAFFQAFKDWSVANKLLADDTEHECQLAKPGPPPPSQQSRGTTKERFGGTTTMKEDYRSWDVPRRKEEPDRPKKTTRQKIRHPKSDENASSCHASKTNHCPDENGALSNLKCNWPETEDSRMYWTRSLHRVSWNDGGICGDPPQVHQMITCMVSSRS